MKLRHPTRFEVAAWFDGEGRATAGSHIVACARCRRRVSEVARVRAWVRAQPFYEMGEQAALEATGDPTPSARSGAAIAALVEALRLGIISGGQRDPQPE